HHTAAVERVAAILQREQPGEVFIPYRREEPADHRATTGVVREALLRLGRPADVFEYPVWFWNHWPWVPLGAQGHGLRRELRESLGSLRRLFSEVNRFVRARRVLGLKHAALAQHRSQVERLIPNARWETLGDVSGGDLLRCFFQDVEAFCHYRFPG